jgi:hypothetical protein
LIVIVLISDDDELVEVLKSTYVNYGTTRSRYRPQAKCSRGSTRSYGPNGYPYPSPY